jgi:hypothetical protein
MSWFACHYGWPRVRSEAVANTLVANGISAVPVVAIDGSVMGLQRSLVIQKLLEFELEATMNPALRLAVMAIGVMWFGLQQAQSQDHVFANPPMLSSHNGRLDVDLVTAPGTYTIDGHQFQGMLYNGAYIPPVWRVSTSMSCGPARSHIGALLRSR